MRRLIFGGSFDPVHVGHLELARQAGRRIGADRVHLMPAADPPHKRTVHASAEDRLEMVRRAVADDPYLEALDVEVRRGGTSYTVDTVEELATGLFRGDALALLIGQDSLGDLPGWRRGRELAERVPIVVVPRPGAPDPDWEALERGLGAESVDRIRRLWLPLPEIDASSTDVRRRRREGRSIRCRVPDGVADYIEERGLYLADDGAREAPG